MPITLDPSLPPSLYPLAWLVGSWEGSGAVHRPGADGRRIEQRLDCTAREDGTLAWRSVVHVIDDPAPLPPTSAFARADAPVPTGGGERSLLLREDGVWSVGDPLPGQDLAAADAAPPGDPSGILSYALTARFERPEQDAGTDATGGEEQWSGEARGPRIQLALEGAPAPGGAPTVAATRMFGYVGGRLMWLWERASDESADDLAPFISVELDRV